MVYILTCSVIPFWIQIHVFIWVLLRIANMPLKHLGITTSFHIFSKLHALLNHCTFTST